MKLNKLMTTSMVGLALLAATPVACADDVAGDNANTPATTQQSSQSTPTFNNGGQSVQTKQLSKPYMVFGAGLSDSERQQVAQVLAGNSSAANFTNLTATGQDYGQYVGNGQATTDSAMISSVALQPADPGTGINVSIKDFDGKDNITQVTPQQYAMAAACAGVKDMNIVVTANTPVSGTSALTGVYKALAVDGIQLNSKNTAAANGLLQATQPAVQANQGDSQYAGKLVQAVLAVAQQVAQDRQNGKMDSASEIQSMLMKQLQKQGIASETPQSAINQIVQALVNFEHAPVAKTSTVVNTIKNVQHNVANNKNGNMINANDWKDAHMNFFERLWKMIVHAVNVYILRHDPTKDASAEKSQEDQNSGVSAASSASGSSATQSSSAAKDQSAAGDEQSSEVTPKQPAQKQDEKAPAAQNNDQQASGAADQQ